MVRYHASVPVVETRRGAMKQKKEKKKIA